MRLMCIGLVLTTSMAWASEPLQPEPQPAAAPAATAEPAPAVAAPKPAAKEMTLDEARKAGYKIVNENGKTVYCRDQMKTGSRVRRDTICMTAQEIEAAREASQRNLDQMQRAIPPPHGT
jgi:hypothetical protein